MSLRPHRVDAVEDASFAYSRMAPNGRRWSESPVPRPKGRQVRQFAVPAPPPDPPEWAITSLHFGYPDAEPPTYELGGGDFAGYDTGNAITIVVGVDAAPALPTGWTSLASGTHGDYLDYVIGTRAITGTDDWVVDLPGLPSDWNTGSYPHKPRFKVAAFTVIYGGVNDGALAATVSTSTGSSGTFPTSSRVAPWNALIGAPSDAAYQPGGPTYSDRFDMSFSDYPTGPTTIGYVDDSTCPYYVAVFGAPDAYSVSELTGTIDTVDGYYAQTLGDPISFDWVSFAVGWE